jgi:hypothetical protein
MARTYVLQRLCVANFHPKKMSRSLFRFEIEDRIPHHRDERPPQSCFMALSYYTLVLLRREGLEKRKFRRVSPSLFRRLKYFVPLPSFRPAAHPHSVIVIRLPCEQTTESMSAFQNDALLPLRFMPQDLFPTTALITCHALESHAVCVWNSYIIHSQHLLQPWAYYFLIFSAEQRF